MAGGSTNSGLLGSIVLAALALGSSASPLTRRQVTTDASVLNGATYDYLIVGGGTAGLALANRLSADAGTSVAVIESGGSGNEVQDRLLSPGLAYLDGAPTLDSPCPSRPDFDRPHRLAIRLGVRNGQPDRSRWSLGVRYSRRHSARALKSVH
jgi:choline dehydrogenase-like flavoprotein